MFPIPFCLLNRSQSFLPASATPPFVRPVRGNRVLKLMKSRLLSRLYQAIAVLTPAATHHSYSPPCSYHRMADEDNFDIDIYGTDNADPNDDYGNGQSTAQYDSTNDAKSADRNPSSAVNSNPNDHSVTSQGSTASSHTVQPSVDINNAPQGVKRKSTMDDRPVDHNSSNAVQIIDLHWWVTEDDLRGWCHQAACEDEVKEITFNEHKVNGKSKGFVMLANALVLSADMDTVRYTLSSRPKLAQQL